jgi:hypothetical protein
MAKMGNSAGPGLGGDQVQSLLIDVRASTQGFSEDLAVMRGTFDSTLVEGFSRAGNVLEKGLLGAIRRGSLGFDDLKRVALDAMGQIAAQSVGILGLPGRATGGTVSPGRGYLVGERGPELFIPTSAGRVESNATARGGAREVRVSINVITPPGSGAPQALQRSTRQVASAVRRALTSS